jgi:hypothetical protein
MTTYKGTHITNFDSKPFTSVNGRLHGGVKKIAVDTFELADTADADDVIVFRLPIDAIIHRLEFGCDDLGDAGTVDIGVHKKNADGTYTAVDADAFANNIDVNSSAVAMTDYRFSAQGIETANEALWELASLTSRPDYADLYISLTTDTGTTAAATVTMRVEYTE